ncbi:MAG: arginine--tRNA ligase [Pseudomonadota bacterium]
MSSLTARLTERVAAAFTNAGLDDRFGQVTVSNRPDLAQFQCNGALAAAKQAKTNPRQLAEAVAQELRDDAQFQSVEIAGPGFLNLTLTDEAIAAHIAELAGDARLGVPVNNPASTVVLDYGGPNVAKPMHVGHIRATVIGDSLRRLFAFAGDRTIADVHMGDWGLPMGKLVSALEIEHPDWPYFDAAHEGAYPTESPITLDDLERIYPEADAACSSDPDRMQAARAATFALQNDEPGVTALWRHFMEISVAAMKENFDALGVHFDLYKGEADVHHLIAPMVKELQGRGLAETDDGAVIVRVARPDDKSEMPPLILLKSDGAVMYGTTDLATIKDRVAEYDPDLIFYVVDQRQHLHFAQVFRAAELAGYGHASLEHLGFGTVNGPDGKPFRTRDGGVPRLSALIDMAREKSLERMEEANLAADMPQAERVEIARQVGLAAIKFADLSNHRQSNYVFDLDRFTRFEGKTGPYLQYAAVRVKSLLRRAADQGYEPGTVLPPSDVERDLMLTLGQMPDAIAKAYDKRAPNELCDFAFALAQEFSRFYAATHILSEEDPAKRAAWLGLAKLTLDQLSLQLDLLGIEVPDRM